ncbi:MAG: SDR family NAD(P)-dependent oxidoreductase, partial [Pseudomonadota bacterium]
GQLLISQSDSAFHLELFSIGQNGEWTRHSDAQLRDAPVELPVTDTTAAGSVVDVAAFYAAFDARGLNFGGSLHGVNSLSREDGRAVATIHAPVDIEHELSHYDFHPALLDACIQCIGAAVPGFDVADTKSDIFMPFSIGECTLRATEAKVLRSVTKIISYREDADIIQGQVFVSDESGVAVAFIDDIQLKRVAASQLTAVDGVDPMRYQIEWRERAEPQLLSESVLDCSAGAVASALCESYPEISGEHGLDHYYAALPRLEEISAQYIESALHQLGWRTGEALSVQALAEQLGILKKHQRLLRRFLQILQAAGRASYADGVYARCSDTLGGEPDNALSILLGDVPALSAEAELVQRCGPHLHTAISGKIDPLDLLFPKGDTEAGAAIYTRSPLARVFNGSVARAVESALASVPEGAKLRVLEIGGGTGGTTRFIADRVDMTRVDYTFSDLGGLFVSRAEERFSKLGDFSFQVLDIEKDPQSQGLLNTSFDLVIASNIIHATRDLASTLSNIRGLLADRGMLVMTEVIAKQNWIDLSFGMTEGWWHYTDTELRGDYPLLPIAEWNKLLSAQGFGQAEQMPASKDADPMNAILVAQARPTASGYDANTQWVFADTSFAREFLSGQTESAHWIAAGETPLLSATESTVRRGSKSDIKALLENANQLKRILFFWPLDDAGNSSATASSKALLALVQALLEENQSLIDGLWVITGGAQFTGIDERELNPAQAACAAMCKAISLEHPELNCRNLDLDATDASDNGDALIQLLQLPGQEPQLAIRGQTTLVPRLVGSPRLQSFLPAADVSLRLESTERGMLDNLRYSAMPLVRPAADEVLIRVRASGLNFRDVLNALGNYAGGEVPFGSECAGELVVCGDAVDKRLQSGMSVLAIAPNSLSDYVIAKAPLVVAKPASLSFAQAACLPIAYLTAHYCLHAIGGLKPGERVFIHAGAGGVGMAAIELAHAAGAEVYASAGSPRKRRYLKQLGVKAVFNSRTLAFADELRNVLPEGVDLLINALADEFIPASLSIMADRGRFVEIGRSGIWTQAQVHAKRADVAYHIVDLSSDMSDPDAQMQSILTDIVHSVEAGNLGQLPVRQFSRDQTVDAFRYMAQARHIGKVAISAPFAEDELVDGDGQYLITGAFGGLGLTVSEWLAASGARHLRLMGRNAPSTDAQQRLDVLKRRGVRIDVHLDDVADEDALRGVFASIDLDDASLKGIYHCAGQLSDAPLLQQDWPSFEKVFAAKVHGSYQLSELSAGYDLDAFVTFSSLASVLGSRGQANHCAANGFMDALALQRQMQGLPATNINWGVWAGAGAALQGDVLERTERKGLASIDPDEGFRLMRQLMQVRRGQSVVQSVNWGQYLQTMKLSAVQTLFLSEVAVTLENERKSTAKLTSQSIRDALLAAPEDQRGEAVLACVLDEVRRILGLDGNAMLADDMPLKDAGLDSLMAVELRNALGARIDEKLPATLMFDYPTIGGVVGFLVDLLFPKTEQPDILDEDEGADDLDSLFAGIENLSDQEADDLLRTRTQGK